MLAPTNLNVNDDDMSAHRVVFFLQVFCIQFYLGTTRLQLEHKGDGRHGHHYTNFANIIVSFGFVCIPVIGWLLDHKGYGVTLGCINAIGVICSVLEAIPSLRLQVSNTEAISSLRLLVSNTIGAIQPRLLMGFNGSCHCCHVVSLLPLRQAVGDVALCCNSAMV